MDRPPPLKGRPYVYRRGSAEPVTPVQKPVTVSVVFDRGSDRRPDVIPCSVIETRFDAQSRRLATVVAPMTGKRLEVVFSAISKTWRPIRS